MSARRGLYFIAAVTWLAWGVPLLLQLGLSIRDARGLSFVGNYDTANYYLIAREFAVGHGLTDPVRWHHLGSSASVVRPAGDYWAPGWPALLGVALRVFGTSQVAAIWFCALLSLGLPLVVYAVTRSASNDRAAGFAAALLVVLQERLRQTNVTPDMTLAAQLLTGLALLAVLHARCREWSPTTLLLAGAVAVAPVLVRTDLVWVAVVGAAWVALAEADTAAVRGRRLGMFLLGVIAVHGAYLACTVVGFGSLTPEPRRLATWMTRYEDLYYLLSDPAFTTWRAQGLRQLLELRLVALQKALAGFRDQLPVGLFVVAAIGAVAWRRSNHGAARALVAAALLASVLTPILLVPVVASPDRMVLIASPLLCVLAGFVVPRLLVRRGWVLMAAVILVTVVFGACWPHPGAADRFRNWRAPFLQAPLWLDDLARVGMGSGAIILTNEPWHVALATGRPTVMLPYDGPRAIERAIELYHPTHVVITAQPPLWAVALSHVTPGLLSKLYQSPRMAAFAVQGR